MFAFGNTTTAGFNAEQEPQGNQTHATTSSFSHSPEDQNVAHDIFRDIFTATGYTDDDLNLALEAQRDVLGTSAPTPPPLPSPHVVQTAKEGLLQALEILPLAQRSAYQVASFLSPHVVEMETPLERFLVAHGFNYWEAAFALCEYWNQRRELFGQERYHLPLTIAQSSASGDEEPYSALPRATVEVIESGLHNILPPDKYHRPVLLVDREAVPDDFQNNLLLRFQMLFYFLHVLSEWDVGTCCSKNRTSTRRTTRVKVPPPGYVALMAAPKSNTNTAGAPSSLVKFVSEAKYFPFCRHNHYDDEERDASPAAASAAPAKRVNTARHNASSDTPGTRTNLCGLKAVHVLLFRQQDDEQESPWRKAFGVFLWSLLNQIQVFTMRLRFHHVTTPRECCERVQEYGLGPQHLPARFGGTANFQDWYQERLSLERERYASIWAKDATQLKQPPVSQEQPQVLHASPIKQSNKEQDGLNDDSSSDSYKDADEEMFKSTDVAATESSSSSPSNSESIRKRSMDELILRGEDLDQQQTIERIKRQKHHLLQQRKKLKKEHNVLESSIVVTQHLARQYEMDRSRLIDQLCQSFARIISPPLMKSLADTFLCQMVQFHGRSLTGEYYFSETPRSKVWREHIPHYDEIKQILFDTKPSDKQDTLKDDGEVETAAAPSGTREAGKTSPQSDQSDEDDAILAALQTQVEQLQRQRNSLVKQHQLLQAYKVCADRVVSRFSLHSSQNLCVLAKEVASMLIIVGYQDWHVMLKTRHHPVDIAERLLLRTTCWLDKHDLDAGASLGALINDRATLLRALVREGFLSLAEQERYCLATNINVNVFGLEDQQGGSEGDQDGDDDDDDDDDDDSYSSSSSSSWGWGIEGHPLTEVSVDQDRTITTPSITNFVQEQKKQQQQQQQSSGDKNKSSLRRRQELVRKRRKPNLKRL